MVAFVVAVPLHGTRRPPHTTTHCFVGAVPLHGTHTTDGGNETVDAAALTYDEQDNKFALVSL